MTELTLVKNAKSYGNKIAFKGTNSLTYAELLEKSASVASALLNGKTDLDEERIAFAAPGGPEYAIIQWGIWRAGGIAVPLNMGSTIPEMQHCIECASVSQIITLSTTKEKVQPLVDDNGLRQLDFDAIAQESSCDLPDIETNRRALIIFTSGTTNKPTGVVSTHKTILAQTETLIDFWEWRADDVIPLFLPMHHIHGIINVMTCALYKGATLDAYSSGFDMDRLLDEVSKGSYTLFMAVPTIYVKLIQALEALDDGARAKACAGFKAMRLMISGSAALPVKIHKEWQALTGQILLERYGMTEIGMGLSNPMEGERRPGAVGVPLPGVTVQLVAEDKSVVEGEDTPGEIWVKGDNVFSEYWNNPKATEESFTDGWFMTGDMAVREQGYYRIMGRLSVDIIKSGGYKLSALEIENYLLAHDDISECAVVGINDDTWGETVAATVVLADGKSMTLDELKNWSKDKMSNYKIPRTLLCVDALPRNAMGKVTKADVKKLF